MSASKDSKPHNEQELRLKGLYGRIPSKRDLLDHQLEVKYFDSGDFCLSQASKSSDTGAVKTGAEHPLREGISHPFSAVPSSSNVNYIGQQQEEGNLEAGVVRRGSQLREIAGQAPRESGEANK
ncbi:cAMP-regulated phosphoprotein/endosulfine conserved region domain-containing protein [Purpureocillium lilacinum]|uniref:mRNA stability protein n=1 Tax=Purpureocillium lilacinum TaxID=33203 RepID=A0A179FAV7_PURLI|nr:cAMP-regulated phosphoprotein/endosulfine conserved region domain-containing protein [Purpureocillium lilacinum]